MMGGQVGVDSRPSAGSRFWFTAELQVECDDDTAAAALWGQRALLVDDLAEARLPLRQQLQMFGLKVDDFDDPAAAIERAVAEKAAGRGYDVLLLDHRMAPHDGPQTLGRLRAMLGTTLLPAILVSADDDELSHRKALAAGFIGLLPKPVSSTKLHDILAGVLLGASPCRAPQATALGPSEVLLRARHHGSRVLLAEDSPINQEVARELLCATGLAVEVVGNGQQAVDRALSGRYDLVLMDIQMPEVDGLEAARRIRAGGRSALPIVAMTASAYGEDRQDCLDAGMNDHVAKPVDPKRLYPTLARWLPSDATRVVTPADAPQLVPLPQQLRLQEQLAGIEGQDVEREMHVAGGSPDLLMRLLHCFVEAYGDTTIALTPGHTYSLRGACATVGAVRLAAA